MDNAELQDAVRKAWQAGAAMAMLSLKEENLAQAEETEELQLPDHSDEGTDILLYILQTAPSEDQLLLHACKMAAAGVGADDRRTELDKRMLYRQMVIAAGYFSGRPEMAQEMAVLTEEALLLDPDS